MPSSISSSLPKGTILFIGHDQGAGNFWSGEAADGTQGKHDLRLWGEHRMAAGKDEAKDVVEEFFGILGVYDELGEDLSTAGIDTALIDQFILCSPENPSGWLIPQALDGPIECGYAHSGRKPQSRANHDGADLD